MCFADAPFEKKWCDRHTDVCLGYASPMTGCYKPCPVCQDNKMYQELAALGLEQKMQSNIMDIIEQVYGK